MDTGPDRRLEAVLRPVGGNVKSVDRAAKVVNTSVGGALLEVPETASRWLGENQLIQVEFRLRNQPTPYEALARVVRMGRSEVDRTRVLVGVRFEQQARFQARLDEAAWPYFNRRQVERTQLDAESELEVQLVAPGLSLRGHIDNLCLLGLASSFEGGLTESVLELPQIRLGFFLPDEGEPLRFHATARHATSFGLEQRVGFAFDAEATPGFATRSEALARFLISRKLRAPTP